MLSGIGRKIIGFFNQISREHEEFLVSKRNEVDLVARSEKKVKILVRKLHESNLIIDSYIFPVGERRKYHTRHFPSESPFKDFYETEECLEEIVERDRKCKVIQRIFSEPYPGWCKVFRSPRTDGLN